MGTEPPSLTDPARSCLILLGLLLVGSIAMRLHVYAGRSQASGMSTLEADPPPIDLGAGVTLPRDRAGRYHVPGNACSSPILVTFVWVGPYGSDPSLEGTVHPGDRVSYIWHGWNLGHRLATVGLNAIYFARLAHARLTTGRNPEADDVALRIVVPAACDASPDDVLAALRLAARS